MVEEHRRKSFNKRGDRRATNHVSPRYKNVFTAHDVPYPNIEIHEDAKNRVNNDRKSKRHSPNNSDNRRMTGNVNIYICSETNNNPVSSLCVVRIYFTLIIHSCYYHAEISICSMTIIASDR